MKLLPKGIFWSIVLSLFVVSSPLIAVSYNQTHVSSLVKKNQNVQMEMVERIAVTAQRIISLPIEEEKFENTLGAWQGLIELLSFDSHNLKGTGYLDLNENTRNDLESWFREELNQNPELYQILRRNAIAELNNQDLNHFKKHIASCFIKNSEEKIYDNILYLNGLASEKPNNNSEYAIVDLGIREFIGSQTSELAEKILSSAADIVCLREISSEDSKSLYEALRSS